jgi:hypothetical protein
LRLVLPLWRCGFPVRGPHDQRHVRQSPCVASSARGF